MAVVNDAEVAENWALFRLGPQEPGPFGEPEVAILETIARTTYLTAPEARRLAHKLLDWTGGMTPSGTQPGGP